MHGVAHFDTISASRNIQFSKVISGGIFSLHEQNDAYSRFNIYTTVAYIVKL